MEYSWSTDEENYQDNFDTPEAAAAEGFAQNEEEENLRIFVGENETPDPAGYIDADLVLEHITEQEEFCIEVAAGWTQSKTEKDDLTARLRKSFTDWMDEHKQHPSFWTVKNVEEYGKDLDGNVVKIPKCPACRRSSRVEISPPESTERGKYFCPCNEPGSPGPSGHFND